MSDSSAPDPIQDARLAAQIFMLSPQLFGGMVLRGSSPARDALIDTLGTMQPLRRLPAHVDDERLMGGIDIAASLASGMPVTSRGLLHEAQGGSLLVPMAERMEESLAGRLAQALDDQITSLILLDDGLEEDDTPPASLCERLAFICDLRQARQWERLTTLDAAPKGMEEVAPLDQASLRALAQTAAALGIHSLRPLFFAAHAARASAALNGRSAAEKQDLENAARLILAPRAVQLPPMPEEQQQEEPPPPKDDSANNSDSDQIPDGELQDLVLEAAAAAIPADLLAQLTDGRAPRRSSGSGAGKKRKGGLRGKPLGARPGMPRGGSRLALIDSLRAAVPWQPVRKAESTASDTDRIIMRKDDLRVRRFEDKSARVTVFVVDASGSAAAARLAEAKGAVELMLAQAYVTRSEVALIAFRGDNAELLLPPTRSLTRARRALAELPGGGGTPLAIGLNVAREAAQAIANRGKTPALVILTDGRANIDANGEPGRKQAGEDAETAAKAIAREAIDALIVDISARPGKEGPALARAMGARFLALPRADAQALHKAVHAAQPHDVTS